MSELVERIERIVGAHIEIPVDAGWLGSLNLDIAKRAIEREAEEVLEKVQTLKGIKGVIVYETRSGCTGCRWEYEEDAETGLTACCGKPFREDAINTEKEGCGR